MNTTARSDGRLRTLEWVAPSCCAEPSVCGRTQPVRRERPGSCASWSPHQGDGGEELVYIDDAPAHLIRERGDAAEHQSPLRTESPWLVGIEGEAILRPGLRCRVPVMAALAASAPGARGRRGCRCRWLGRQSRRCTSGCDGTATTTKVVRCAIPSTEPDETMTAAPMTATSTVGCDKVGAGAMPLGCLARAAEQRRPSFGFEIQWVRHSTVLLKERQAFIARRSAPRAMPWPRPPQPPPPHRGEAVIEVGRQSVSGEEAVHHSPTFDEASGHRQSASVAYLFVPRGMLRRLRRRFSIVRRHAG